MGKPGEEPLQLPGQEAQRRAAATGMGRSGWIERTWNEMAGLRDGARGKERCPHEFRFLV